VNYSFKESFCLAVFANAARAI